MRCRVALFISFWHFRPIHTNRKQIRTNKNDNYHTKFSRYESENFVWSLPLLYINSTCSSNPSGSDVAFARCYWPLRRCVMMVVYVLLWFTHTEQKRKRKQKRIKEKISIKENFRLRFCSLLMVRNNQP